MRKLLTFAGLGAALTYFFDPQSGAGRRALVRDRTVAFFRRSASDASRMATSVQADAKGAVQKAKRREEKLADHDDATLARKVETVIFRDPDVPKGQIGVDAEDGIVVLRGEVDRTALIEDLEQKTRNVQGVKGVENLLHLPGAEPERHQVH